MKLQTALPMQLPIALLGAARLVPGALGGSVPDATCTRDNLDACGDPPLSFANMCEDGSITIAMLIALALVFFVSMHAVYYFTHRDARKRGITSRKKRWSISGVLEDLFIMPFVPTSLESLITIYSFMWWMFTAQMAITRYYGGYWATEWVTQHGFFNLLSYWLGCKTLPHLSVMYTDDKLDDPSETKKPSLFGKKSEEEVFEEEWHEHSLVLDRFFQWHLFFGLLWLA